jgi:hypothetical protein
MQRGTRAKIVHFHGPKPSQRPNIETHHPELKFLTGGADEELCATYEELRREAGSRTRKARHSAAPKLHPRRFL